MTAPRRRAGKIDWQEVRARLSRAAAALEDAHQLTPENVRVALDARALAAARIPVQPLDAGAVIEVVRFDLGDEHYALETTFVREILRIKEITPLPGAPDFLVGITNLRGQILAVLDLRRFFGIAAQTNTERSRVIVLGQERIEFGVLADGVHEVTLLQNNEIREPPGSVAGLAREYLRGVTADALLVLDGAVLLQDPRLTIDLGDNNVSESVEAKI